jgi:hypothetical protein
MWGLLVRDPVLWQLNLALCRDEFRPCEVADLQLALAGEHQQLDDAPEIVVLAG